MSYVRLDSFLLKLGIGTKKEVKKIISNKRVKVNKELVSDSGYKLRFEEDEIELDNKVLKVSEFEYFVINKPKNCVCALNDNLHKTVMEYINEKRQGLAIVGRLDLDTTGVLLITDDGKLNHNLLSPKRHVKKTYLAKVKGNLPKGIEKLFEAGVMLNDGITKPAKIKVLKEGEISSVEVSIVEGRYHQVKRMFLAFNCEVVDLERIEFASLKLKDLNLAYGEYRKLSEDEIKSLKENF